MKIENLEEKQLHKVFICDGVNEVAFCSDNEKEILAVNQYFDTVWKCKSENFVGKENICKIISCYIDGYDELYSKISFEFKKNIFYDMQDGFVYENDKYYICSRLDGKGITVFCKNMKLIYFLRKSNEILNIHISQLIKEPLNSFRKYNGGVLLHCSACVFNDKAIIFPALKAAGKSTILMAMMSLGGKYMGNDSLFINLEKDSIIAKKNPHAIRLGKQTVEYNPQLKEYFSKYENCEDSKMIFSKIELNGKVQFVTKSLHKIFSQGCIYDEEIPVSYFVFPTLDITSHGQIIRKLNRDEAIKKMMECVRNKDHRINWLPFYPEEKLDSIEKEIMTQIYKVFSDSTYELIYSGDALSTARVVKEYLNL